MRRLTVMCVISGLAVGSILSGCGTVAPASEQPVPLPAQAQYEQVDEVKYAAMSVPSGLPAPEEASYREMSEQEAVNLFAMVAVIAGVVSSASDFPDGSIAVAKGFSPAENSNVYRIQGLNFQTDIRTKDCLVTLAARFGPEDPVEPSRLVPLGEAEAQARAEHLYVGIQEAQEQCLERSENLPSKQPETYRLTSFSGSNQTGPNSWWISWERVSPAGIPYRSEGAALHLRADGIFAGLNVHRGEECADSEPVITAEEAYAIARPLLEQHLEEIRQEFSTLPGERPAFSDVSIPDSVELVYVSWVSGGTAVSPSAPRANRLAWALDAEWVGDVYVDALTGEVSTAGLMHYR